MVRGYSRSLLILAWLAAFLAVAILSWRSTSYSTHFFGIADDLEQTIRFSSAVNIIAYPKLAGAAVTQGEVIVEVAQPELDAQLRRLEEQIIGAQLSSQEARSSIAAQIVELESENRAALTVIDADLRDLKERQLTERALLRNRDVSDRLSVEVNSLRVRRNAVRQAARARIDDLKSQLASAKRPVDAQIEELRKQQQELERMRAALSVRAQNDGRIGSQLFQVGDRVPPFEPVMTVHGGRPSFIKGFIHEQVFNNVVVSQKVWIQSATAQSQQWHAGVIASLGARIVEFPVRLKVNPLAQAWGREVVVTLSEGHTLLLGEKVQIQLTDPNAWWQRILSLKEVFK